MKKTDYFQIAKQKLKYFNYAPSTISTYSHYIDEFIKGIDTPPSKISQEDFTTYLQNYEFSSVSQQNQVINALKFFFDKVLDKKYKSPDFQRPRKEKPLPRVIDQDQIKASLEKIRNLKHKAILSLAYSVGLRRSEVINLKIEDIDSSRMIIHVRDSKFNKDRIVPLSHGVLELLRRYFKAFRPDTYLFNGQGNLKYSGTSCLNLMKKHISSNHRFHDLRHSCFTHLVESNVNQRIIQKIAGHSSSKTTEIYTHVSRLAMADVPLPI